MKPERLLLRTAIEPTAPHWQKYELQGIRRWLKAMGNLLSQALCSDREPKVYHRRDRRGHSYLEVYDPTSSQTHQFDTTQEVRVWLEQRYYS
jgi:hypothetical protein